MMNMSTSEEQTSMDRIREKVSSIRKVYTFYIEKTMNYPIYRWIVWLMVVALFARRIYHAQGYYLIVYTLALYVLNLFLGFLSPLEVYDDDTAELPTRDATEFRPFIRRVPEFKLWKESLESVVLSFFLTFIPLLDIPVFWPILVVYFMMLFMLTMRDRIAHMIHYRYLPWSHGKKRYDKD